MPSPPSTSGTLARVAAGPVPIVCGTAPMPGQTLISAGEARRISTQDIQQVQNLVERCLQKYMSQHEIVQALHSQAKIEPSFTMLVWQKLEEQNPEFFHAYYMRLKVKDQVIMFNTLLETHCQTLHKLHASWAQTFPPVMPPPGLSAANPMMSMPPPGMQMAGPLPQFNPYAVPPMPNHMMSNPVMQNGLAAHMSSSRPNVIDAVSHGQAPSAMQAPPPGPLPQIKVEPLAPSQPLQQPGHPMFHHTMPATFLEPSRTSTSCTHQPHINSVMGPVTGMDLESLLSDPCPDRKPHFRQRGPGVGDSPDDLMDSLDTFAATDEHERGISNMATAAFGAPSHHSGLPHIMSEFEGDPSNLLDPSAMPKNFSFSALDALDLGGSMGTATDACLLDFGPGGLDGLDFGSNDLPLDFDHLTSV